MPDLARAAVELLDLAGRLKPYEVVHFAGYLAPRQREFMEMIAGRAGHPGLGVHQVPWRLLRNLGGRDEGLNELAELRHIYEDTLVLDDPRRRELLPGFVETPLEEAVSATLSSYRAAGETF
ncbi:MAG: hypothetical protein HY049_00170 [Acidobacteria bacterium]|nr:hypothetical protein [Acidobacteriota bacterium]